MRALMRNGADDLPSPGEGFTADRWRSLAIVGTIDLSLAKVFESHADARAILREVGEPLSAGSLLAVWAAENPRRPLIFDPATSRLTGTKSWCSGAAIVDEGLLTAKTPDGGSVLVRVDLHEDGVALPPAEWASAGIAAAETRTVTFDRVSARPVGIGDVYLNRPGFWQGGAGIAAVWYGGAIAVVGDLADAPRAKGDPHCAAHLGAIHAHLEAARALLVATAAWIDAHPRADASGRARTLRAAVEFAATQAVERTGRALGAAPLCLDRAHARRVADLEIFLRQSHAERDLAALGESLAGNDLDRLW